MSLIFKKERLVTLFHIPPVDKTAPLLIMNPGNPAVVRLYVPYLTNIHSMVKNIEILAISHICQDAESMPEAEAQDCSASKGFDLDSQIECKTSVIEEHLANNKDKRRIYIIGHSAGAYMSQRVAMNLLKKGYDVQFVGLVFPTIIDISKSSSGVKLTNFCNRFPSFESYAARFVSVLNWALPEYLWNYVISNFYLKKGISGRAAVIEHLRGFLKCPGIVKQTLALARDEMHTINNDAEFNEEYFGTNIKHWCFFASKDHWVSDDTRDHIISKYFSGSDANKKYEIAAPDSGIEHGFVIGSSEVFAQKTVEALQSFGL